MAAARPADELSPLDVVLALQAVQAAVTRRFDREVGGAHGLSLNDVVVLRALAEAPGRRLRRVDLADALALTPSGVTRLLLPLERVGWVARQANPRDARVAYAALTDAGAERLAEALVTAERLADEVTEGLSAADRRQLGAATRQVIEGARP